LRRLFIVLALIAAGAAAYMGTLGKSSYASYSSEQLDLMQRELESARGSERDDFQSWLLRKERRRSPSAVTANRHRPRGA
jgi:hypothetical protein